MKNLYLFIATVLFSSILSAQKVVILKNLAPGDQDGLKLSSQIITFNGKTYFSGNNGSFGYYLYETDGTAKGTKRVSDNITGVENFTVSGNALYFYGYADDTPSGYTLFRFSETNVISKVKAISDIIHIIPFGKAGALFTKKNLSGTFELWKTDSTAASNILLGTFDFDLYSTYFSTFNNSVIISEKSSNSNQFESIITDGTLAGTKKLKDFLAPAIIFEKIGSVTSVKDKIFVEGRVKDIDGSIFNRKFVTNGTKSNTIAIDGYDFYSAYEINNTIFVFDGSSVNYYNNTTKKLQFIADKGGYTKPIVNNGLIFFHDGNNFVWVLDAAKKTAKKVSTQSAGNSNYDPILFAKGDSIFYTSINNNGQDWRAVNLKTSKDSIFTNFSGSLGFKVYPTMAALDNQLIFSRITDAEGSELWTYGGSVPVAPLVATVKITTPIKCNKGTAQLEVAVTGGVSPYTYKWSDTKLVGDKPLATANSYTVTVTDSKGTASTYSINVTQPSAITLTTTAKATTSSQKNGTATATVSGGTSPYKYLWNTTPAQTTATATNLDKGTYTVTVTDANLCTATTTVSVGLTATNEVWQKYKFEIYPNPASEWLNVKFENIENTPTTVSIIDMNGRLIQEQVLDNNSKSINISAIPQGIYLLKCKLGTNETATSTVFIQR